MAANDAPALSGSTALPYFRATVGVYNGQPQNNENDAPVDELARFHPLASRMTNALVRITSTFGHRHNPLGKGEVFHRGIDMAAPTGTPVQAVADGTVIKAASDRSYGLVVIIDHHNGYRTLYAHSSKLLVKQGEQIKAGQTIANVGSTGRSTGSHLHFEVQHDGECVDPTPFLAAI